MIYIHSFKDFNLKNAEIESVPIIREIKQKTTPPLTMEKLRDEYEDLFVTQNHIRDMLAIYQELPGLVEMIQQIKERNDPLFEEINLDRAISMLTAVHEPLKGNIVYAQEMYNYQTQFFTEFTEILASLKQLSNPQATNAKINELFSKLLRSDKFVFNANGIVNDDNTKSMQALQEAMNNGFFFRVHLDEEVHKHTFNKIKLRIAPHELALADQIQANAAIVKKVVDDTYKYSMGMITLATYMYAYIKWQRG